MRNYLASAILVANSSKVIDSPTNDDIQVKDAPITGATDPISKDAAATRYEGGLIVIYLGDVNGVPTYAANNVTSRTTGGVYNCLASFMVQDDANLYLEKTHFSGTHKKQWKTYEQVSEIARQKAVLDGVAVFEGTRCVDFWLVD